MAYISLTGKPDPEVMAELGRRLEALRKAHGLSRTDVAERAALERRTVARAEKGENPRLDTLVRLLRVYGRLDALDGFIPEPTVSPMDELRRRRSEGGDG
jgi:transcriptional regulator with XRE-family HTH domain